MTTKRPLLMKICTCTGKEDLEVRNIEVTISSRGEPFTFCRDTPVCRSCDLPVLNKESQLDLQQRSDRLYIEKYGLLSPESIKSIRERVGLTPIQFAEYLHVTVPSVYGWENKCHPINRSTEELIRLKCSHSYLYNHPEEINKIKRINEKDLTGNKDFVDEAFKNILLFLVKKVKTSKLYLNKILFYIDFYHFKNHGTSITGSKYVPLQYGPCPHRFQEHFQRYIDEGFLLPRESYEFETVKEPDMSMFTMREMETINHILDLCKDDGGRSLYKISHKEEGFSKTQACQCISYEKYAKELKI